MKVYEIHATQHLPILIDEAWQFFSSAHNLSKITPPEMNLVVMPGSANEEIYQGMLIHYTLTPLLGIRLKWTTEITMVNAPHSFTDTQLKGPYALWEHTHFFEEEPGGVKMTDSVRYALPLGILGQLTHSLIVKKKLDDLFAFRKKFLAAHFNLSSRISH